MGVGGCNRRMMSGIGDTNWLPQRLIRVQAYDLGFIGSRDLKNPRGEVQGLSSQFCLELWATKVQSLIIDPH